MKRNSKNLCLALLVVLTVCAALASTAWATQASLTVGQAPAILTGQQEVKTSFEMSPGQRWECAQASYEATLSKSTSEVTAIPHFTECISGGGFGLTIHFNGCHFVFEVGTKVSSTHSKGSLAIVCPAGEEIEMTSWGTCKTHVRPQTVSGLTFTNIANGDVTVDIDITGFHYEETDAFLCPFTGSSTNTNGALFGSVKLEGFEDLGTHEPPREPPTTTEGGAVSIEVG